MEIIRDNNWLKFRLETIWTKHFPDVALKNNVFVRFGRKSKTRLGSITLGRRNTENPNTIITINGYFIDESIPEFVVDAVLSHELTHYAQGFCSPHEQAFRHPHRGGVVKNEMTGRGLDAILKAEKKWIKENWPNYIKKNS
ncbi:TPA: hypothetical protein DD449_00055 [Candidatus Berkelbacteria bacterium]|uniref:SprT-like domain-containing protein n=1 Tax=Berkelbacteria bacterium GW2011_GWE1_39_12 TaxID=1618337 RepID=A0A0G4B4E0_9BACT|nr:MAG: hypothetical protein UT28_C0001G1037 [Berkelbacteria bacterium GW2011_GWE1_39_12]HBO60067.1 hypothetical protein [Candidatus Berkelbacteria bacterium]